MAYAVTVKVLGQKQIWVTAISGAIVKSIVLYGLFLALFQLMPGIPETMQKGILFSMGWPQLVTGTCGVLLASVIVKRSGIDFNKRI